MSGNHLASINIRHATIVPMDKVRLPPRIIKDGALVIEGNKIVALGKTDEIVKEHRQSDVTLDGSGTTVIPGFVNVHSHIAASCFRGLLEDIEDDFYGFALPLEDFLTESSLYYFSLLGAVEAAKFGVTCVNDVYHYSDATARAIEKVGIRGVVAHKILDVRLSKIKSGVYDREPDLGQRTLSDNVKLVRNWHGKANGRITCRIGTHAPDTCSPDLLREAKKISKELGVGIHIHVAQSQNETQLVRKQYNATSVGYLDSLGFLDSDVLAAHLIYASDADLDTLKERDVRIAHCPSIYGKVGCFPKIGKIYSSGIKVGLGTDWLSMDIWDNLRQAIGVSRILTGTKILSAHRALGLATLESARALNLDNDVGSLAVGKRADVVVVRTKKAHLMPWRNACQNLAYYANGGDVQTVIVDGNIVVQDGEIKTVDEEETIAKAQEAAEQLWSNLPYPDFIP